MTEQQNLEAQAALLDDYRANHLEWSNDQLEDHSQKLKALRLELRNIYVEGAIVHPFIKEHAEKSELDADSLIYAHKSSPTRFEIACDIDGITFRSRGFDQESAVRNWNEGKWYWSTAQIESGRVPAFVIEELEAKEAVN